MIATESKRAASFRTRRDGGTFSAINTALNVEVAPRPSLAARITSTITSYARPLALLLVAAVVMTVGSPAMASESSLPDIGVDAQAMLDDASTMIGGYVAWGIGLAVVIIATWKVTKYVRRAA